MGNVPEWRKDLNIEMTYEFQAELIKNNNNNKTPSQAYEILGLKKKEVISSQAKEHSYLQRKQLRQVADFSSARLDAKASTDYIHKSSATQASSTSQE